MEPSETTRALAECEFFKGMEENDLTSIAGICEERRCQAGEAIFRQGDFGEHLFVIVDGQIHLERSMRIGTRTGNVVIEALGRGRVLGCWSTLLDEPHILMSSAICQRHTRVLVMQGARLRELMTADPLFGFNLMEKLCFLLRDRIQAAYGAMEKI